MRLCLVSQVRELLYWLFNQILISNQDVLAIFSKDHLEEELALVKASLLAQTDTAPSLPLPFDGVMRGFQTASKACTAVAHGISTMWMTFHSSCNSLEAVDMSLGTERRRLMLYNTVAWHWLNVYALPTIDNTIQELVQHGHQDGVDWLQRLTQDVYVAMASRTEHVLVPQSYIPSLPAFTPPCHISATQVSANLADKAKQMVVSLV